MTGQYQAPLSPTFQASAYSSSNPSYGPTANPFFTLSTQFVPRNLNDIIKWTKYITMHSPVVTEVLRKLSTYPITEFVVDTKSEKLKAKYNEIFRSFKLKTTLYNIGFEYYTVGNVFVSLYLPILRSLTCPGCETTWAAKKAKFLNVKSYEFEGECPHCGYRGVFRKRDQKSINVEDINILKWDPASIVLNHNPITGETDYYYKIPADIKKKIQSGDRLFLDTVPWALVEAVKNNQDFKFNKGDIYHLKNTSAGHELDGMAIPPLISLYPLVYYQAALRKANESIASDFMSPMRVIFPQAQTGNSDPVVSISMRNFVGNMTNAMVRHRQDKNHVLIAPVPIGYQAISGEGKTLLVSQEIEQAEESILLSLGVSRELLSGTTNWTSSDVGLRLLENSMKSYTDQMVEFVNWVMNKTASYLTIEKCDISFVPFRLTDDTNLKNMVMGLVQNGQMSTSTLYESMGRDYDQELIKMREDAIAKAVHDIKTKMEVDLAMFTASREVKDKLDKNEAYKNTLAQAQQMAQQLAGMDPASQQAAIGEMQLNDYPMAMLVSKLLEEAATPQPPQPQPDQGQPGPEQGQGQGQDAQAQAQGSEQQQQ